MPILGSNGPPPPPSRLSPPQHGQRLSPQVSLSQDGTRGVYVGRRHLHLRLHLHNHTHTHTHTHAPPQASVICAPIPPYYGSTNGNGPSGSSGVSPQHPAPPSLTTTAASSLLLPTAAVAPPPALAASSSAPPGPSAHSSSKAEAAAAAAAAALPVETSDLVGLNWRDKNYMGVVYTTNDDGTCDPLEVKHVFCFPYGCAV